MATQLIEAYSHPFHLQDYKDDYETALRELIKAKQKKAPLPLEEKTVRRAKVINLMDALRQSVSKAKGSGAARGPATNERRSSSATTGIGKHKPRPNRGPVLVAAGRRKRRAA